MKSYSDLKQSKILAQILPIESADMQYYADAVTKEDNPRVLKTTEVPSKKSMYYTPCWSLSALIELLPNKIVVNNENYFLNFTKKNVEYRGIVTWDGQKCISTKAENLLDTCYNMIVKLKKR